MKKFKPLHSTVARDLKDLDRPFAQVREQTTAREQPVLSPKDKDRDRKDEHLRDEASHWLHEH